MTLEIEEVKRIKLGPGEKLILKFSGECSHHDIATAKFILDDVFGAGNYLIITRPDVDISATKLEA